MNRRGFLGSLVATAAGIWLPDEPDVARVYSFIRRPRGLVPGASFLRLLDGNGRLLADGPLNVASELSIGPSSFTIAESGMLSRYQIVSDGEVLIESGDDILTTRHLPAYGTVRLSSFSITQLG